MATPDPAGNPDIQLNRPIEEINPWDAIRSLAAAFGFDFQTITVNGSSIDFKTPEPKSLGYDISGGEDPALTTFQKRVLGILSQSHDVYKDRSAIYKDNFRSVGRVMVALFPEGRPPLVTAEDYDRWHIFELLIIKLTRYANNYDQPHEDSLLDQLPYLGILGALDQELRERFQAARDKENRERLTYEEAIGRRSRLREQDNEARMYSESDAFEKAFNDDPGTFKGRTNEY